MNQMKHISMNGLPYDKMKGLTPVNNKNNSHIRNYSTDQTNTRNNNTGVRMPTLPSSIKGSIGMMNPGGLTNKKNSNNPLNIAVSDI